MKTLSVAIAFLPLLACAQISTGGMVITGNTGGVTVQAISVAPATASIVTGATQQFIDTETYSDGSQLVGQCSSWSSSSTSIATINSSGLATGVAAGTTNITCTLSGVTSSTAVLTVTSAATFQITTLNLPNGNTSTAYNPTITTANGTNNCTPTWSGTTIPGVTFSSAAGTCATMSLLSGTPSTPGTYSFHLHLVDGASHVADQDYSVQIISLPCTPGPPHFTCSSTNTTNPCPQLGSGTCTIQSDISPACDAASPNLCHYNKACVGGTCASGILFQSTDTVNTTRFDTSINTSGVNCITMITDASTAPGGQVGFTTGGASGAQQSSVNGDFIMVVHNGAGKLMKVDTSGNCLKVVWPPAGSTWTNSVNIKTVFSGVSDTTMYVTGLSGFPSTAIVQLTLDCPSGAASCGGDPTHYTKSQIFDYSWCPRTPGPGTTPMLTTSFDVGGADFTMGLGIGWTQYGDNLNQDGTTCTGQGCGHYYYVFKKATHECAAIDAKAYNLYDFCDPDANGHSSDHLNCAGATPIAYTNQCTPTSTQDGIHAVDMSPLGDIADIAIRCSNSGGPPGVDLNWKFGTGAHVANNVFYCTGAGNLCSGHGKIGELGGTNYSNPNIYYTVFPPTNPSWPLGSTRVAGPWAGVAPCEFHGGWENSGDDSWDAIDTTSVCDTSTYGITLGNPYMNEFVGVDNLHPGSPPVRLNHNFTTGPPSAPAANQTGAGNFGCMYGQYFQSQDGNWLYYSSPMVGNFGLNSGGNQKCYGFAMHTQ